MLQQTQVNTVIPYFHRWMKSFPELSLLAESKEETVLQHWQGLGYYHRAKNILKCARKIEYEHGGKWPEDPEKLKDLPGIGSYTAAAISSFCFNKKIAVLDGNIMRVLSRLFDLRQPIDESAGKRALEESALAIIPNDQSGIFNEALMELGARLCRSGTPDCHLCPLQAHCQTPDPTSLPIKKKRAKITERRHLAFLIHTQENKILIEQRNWAGWLKGFWQFPQVEIKKSIPKIMTIDKVSIDCGKESLLRFTHHITRYKIQFEFRRGELLSALPENWRAVKISELKDIAMSAADNRVREYLLAHAKRP